MRIVYERKYGKMKLDVNKNDMTIMGIRFENKGDIESLNRLFRR